MGEEVAYFTNTETGYVPAKLGQRSSQVKPLRIIQFVVQEVIPDVLKFIVCLIPLIVNGLIGLILPFKKKSIVGQTALVTGGGNGLGRALCLRLAKEGCNVAVVDIDMVGAQRTVADVRKLGVKSEAFLADIANYEEVEKLRLAVEAALGPVDILVNNAGLLAILSITEGKPSDLERILNVNLLSHFWTIRVFIEGMKQRRNGYILGVSSILGYIPLARCIPYVATKFGLRGMMQALQTELQIDGYDGDIQATTLFPTFIATRKELMDLVSDVGLNDKFDFLTPEEVAKEAIDGMLRGKTTVFVASFFVRIFMFLIDLLPTAFTILVIKTATGKLPSLANRAKKDAQVQRETNNYETAIRT
ncbi:17-beta-hydroxysteroid dehydrogenase 13-like isoform X1 [Anopheles darlingi]|uniref:17-beta-hydroxysteroid dehydrogenase 13-like isoform X1 n=1 Tax=Anopheles darlingi TaxID=43151 RepID=UPI00210051DA|nr:17-beta-hydroxysteroid dehydrogenase 13-like isoform X1 [Anopheles darlingi]